jgi:hypothetical protein
VAFEPHVAEQVLRDMAAEARVTVLYNHRLKEKGGVRKSGSRITQIEMENGAAFRAKTFIDCTYEGDLMAFAGVSFAWGRENSKQYGEEFAGVRPVDRYHYHIFPKGVSAYGPNKELLPEIGSEPRGEIGAAHRTLHTVCPLQPACC